MTSPKDVLVNVTLASLRNSPQDWEFSKFEAKNKALDLEVWIANSYYGLKIRGPGFSTGEESAPFTGWMQPWRRAVMKAVRETAAKRLLQAFQERHPEFAASPQEP